MEKILSTVSFYRHGQGHHNIKDPTTGKSRLHLFDPTLTSQGESEALALRSVIEASPPDVAFVSPLWRTLQTCGLALSGLPRNSSSTSESNQNVQCPRYALEDVREGNSRSGCNHRRPLGHEHDEAFPWLDKSLILHDLSGPENGLEWRDDLKDQIEQIRIRACRVLSFLAEREERNIAVFSHQGFIRNVIAVVIGLGRDHSMTMPKTGSVTKIVQVVSSNGQTYWKLAPGTTVEVEPVAHRSNSIMGSKRRSATEEPTAPVKMAALAPTPHTTITALLQTISTALSSGSSDAANDAINDLLQELVQIRKEFPAKSEQRNEFTRSLLSSITTSVTPVQEENKIDVAWDLDDCLIRSLRISKELEPDQSLNTTITERISDNEILHVDDDQIRFRTTLRSFAPLILGILQPFCRQHVFTSASRGYMINVVSLAESFFEQPLFQSKRLSCTDFPKHALVSGKDISKLEIPSHSRGSLLIDDNARYHLSQPRRGLLIPKFLSIDEQDDPSLFGITVGILQAAAAAAAAAATKGGGDAESIERVCISCNPPEYWDDMVIARAFCLSREWADNVQGGMSVEMILAEDTWGSEMIGDDIWNKAVLRVGMKRRKQRFDSGVEYWMKATSKATS